MVRIEKEVTELHSIVLREHGSVPAGWVILPVEDRVAFMAREQYLLDLQPLQETHSSPLLINTGYLFIQDWLLVAK